MVLAGGLDRLAPPSCASKIEGYVFPEAECLDVPVADCNWIAIELTGGVAVEPGICLDLVSVVRNLNREIYHCGIRVA